MNREQSGVVAIPFPSGFLWGAGSSAYQIEGAVLEDGRGDSIWDRFAHTPGTIENDATGDIACDHYHRWSQDLDLMADIGLRAYRFSVAWPRIIPAGTGPPNGPGLDFYSRLVDGLLERGIEPVATLYHWDLPQPLQDRAGGWAGRETADRFGDYALAVFRVLGDRVSHWVTLNEPWVSAFLGYYRGIHAPGLRDLELAVRASHHLLLAHARAVAAFRSTGLDAAIGIALDSLPSSPASDREADRRAAELSDGTTNRWFLDPLLRGDYPTDAETLFAAHGADVGAVVQEGDLAAISAPIDFLGVNYYFRRLVRASAEGLGWTEAPGTWEPESADNEMHWAEDATGLTEQLERIRADYMPIPIYVTENGVALRDEPSPDGLVNDRRRIAFLRNHLGAAERALAGGVDLRGYFAWSLIDDFEWSSGYRPRFGLIHVDYSTQRRTPKASARWYADVIRANSIVDEPS